MTDKTASETGWFSAVPRGGGVLMHLTSLPGGCGIGDLGPPAWRFLDFLEKAGQKYWQILPFSPTDACFDHSPYMGFSAFAGNPLLISPELLTIDGLLDQSDLSECSSFDDGPVDYGRASRYKTSLLKKAFDRFRQASMAAEFDEFQARNAGWLEDYCLFMALKSGFGNQDWSHWPDDIRRRETSAVERWRKKLEIKISFHRFVEFSFHRQWEQLRARAKSKGIRIIGDLPIYVGYDGAEVWVNPGLFRLDPVTLRPEVVAGVPPDYFSETGQRWGNPLYRWTEENGKPNEAVYEWWAMRLGTLLEKVDIVRLDHFRGVEAYWEIPAEEETAVKGRWVKGPGAELFAYLGRKLGSLPIIAEDLGLITPEVEELRDSLKLPGMKVLHFAFDSGPDNPYLPANYDSDNCVVYTGTHDNNNTEGWFAELPKKMQNRVMKYIECEKGEAIHWCLARTAFASRAKVAVLPMQDIMGLSGGSRMNSPGSSKGNWRWRCPPDALSDRLAARLAALTGATGR